MIVISGGPDWASIMTAFGTVGAVAAALGIAISSERRTDTRLTAQREHSDRQLREERDRADARLQAERDTARAREQLAEAYAVQVTVAADRREVSRLDNPWVDAGDWQEAPAAVVVNEGRYTITGIETRFCYPVSGHVVEPGGPAGSTGAARSARCGTESPGARRSRSARPASGAF